MRKWTVMVYMAGDNNLDSNGVADLKEMKRVGSTDEVAIIAQFDRSGSSRRTKRYFIRDFETTPFVRQDEGADLGETNTGSKEEFIKFLRWGMEEFAAQPYLVIIWGHGSGTMDESPFVENGRPFRSIDRRHGIFRPVTRDVSRDVIRHFGLDSLENELFFKLGKDEFTLIAPDDDAKDFLDNIELKDALKAAPNSVDILGMDACLMSMTEICYQVRESVGITVASQAQSEVEGWPFEQFLAQLVQSPGMQPKRLARILVKEFVRLYQDQENVSATLAACRLDKTPELAAAVDRLAATLIARIANVNVLNAIIAARSRVWADELIETVDLSDFCHLLRQRCENAVVKAACTEVIDLIEQKDGIIIDFDKHGEGVDFTHGLGISSPQFEVSPPYVLLDFVNDPGAGGEPSAPKWGEFISRYVEAVSR